MNYNRCLLLCIVVLPVLFSVVGCGSFTEPELGVRAKKESRILLDGAGKGRVFQTDDLKLEYSLNDSGGNYTYTGRLFIDRSITDSFEEITRFTMRMNFLDSEGRVLESVDITPLFTINHDIPNVMKAKKKGRTPHGAKYIAFNYFAVFRGVMAGYRDDWESFYFPFE